MAAFSAEAGITSRGSRYITLRFRAPQLWKNWRVSALLGAGREARFGYFGIGNETGFQEELVTPDQPFFYRVRRARYGGKVELTRRLDGPWHAGFLANVEWTRFTTLPRAFALSERLRNRAEGNRCLGPAGAAV